MYTPIVDVSYIRKQQINARVFTPYHCPITYHFVLPVLGNSKERRAEEKLATPFLLQVSIMQLDNEFIYLFLTNLLTHAEFLHKTSSLQQLNFTMYMLTLRTMYVLLYTM